MQILFLTPGLPHPPIWGFGIRVNQFLRLLARDHDVTLLTFEEPDEMEKVHAVSTLGVTVHTVHRPKSNERDKRKAQLRSMFSRRSYQRRSLYSQAMQAKLDELTRANHYDVIQIESSQLAGFEFDPRAVTVLDEHNIEYELLHRMYQTERSRLRRLYNWLEYTKFKREEISSWRTVSGCVMTSMREQLIVETVSPTTPTITAANAVDAEFFRPSPEPPKPSTLVMTGLMHYRPNIDGAVYFVQEIFPHILAARPETVFYIVGAGATDELRRLESANVVVTGTVPDVRPYAHNASVMVVPLRMGGGTRLKILEGLSMEKPVVSTSIGCEGIDVVDREHLIIADTPIRFAAAVLELMRDREFATRIGKQGRLLAERNYTWQSVVKRLETFYGHLMTRAASETAPHSVVRGAPRRHGP